VPEKRALPKWSVWLLAAAILFIVGAAGVKFVTLAQGPPAFDRLTFETRELAQPVTLIRPTGRGSGGPWISVPLQDLGGRIEDACFLWDCRLPEDLTALKPGTSLKVWRHDAQIWQLVHADDVLLEYGQAVSAFEQMRLRRYLVFGPLALLSIGIFLLVLRRRNRAGGGSRRSVKFSLRISTRRRPMATLDAGGQGGMTLNERLYSAGLLPEFENAVRRRDRDATIAALAKVGLSQAMAVWTADTVLANPEHYGY